MKDLLYRERLKEIQDDMLPFGIIRDSNGIKADKYIKDEEGNKWFETEWKSNF